MQAQDREDDWTGLTDAKARRKRQNRLNQRAYRKWASVLSASFVTYPSLLSFLSLADFR
jgi:hypothetical protein